MTEKDIIQKRDFDNRGQTQHPRVIDHVEKATEKKKVDQKESKEEKKL
jgi:hypothetical protein